MSVISKEIQDDIKEAFPHLLKREYYQFMDSVDLGTKMEASCEESAFVRKEWRIPFCKLKRLDSIDRDWRVTPKLLLHHFPEMLLEPILEATKEDRIGVWQNWSSFPIISTNPMPQIGEQHEPPSSSALKVRHSKVCLDRLAYWEELTTHESCENSNHTVVMNYSFLFSKINTSTPLPNRYSSFLPKTHLDEFKKIPLLSVEKNKLNRPSELDNLRFHF
ncbi:hypothetical protein INT47_002453 [Mucor saturninus]|uniref:Uncharacterized protein n=1 Tax=Mucor saturninus TaxID=64648 RepID=A0A8H7RIZ1_9FUNG|nr:hypothetical protein INT47_002453 [Mucor saturninus]